MRWYSYVFLIVGGLLYAWLVTSAINRQMKSLQKRLLDMDDDEDFGDKIFSKGGMNHFRGAIADGGIGYILQDKLVFIPHNLNLSRKSLTINFCEVKGFADYKIWHIVDTGLKIILQSGRMEKFVVDKTGEFYQQLIKALQNR
ncbi:hypothetical protein FACS1894199_05530 [Bacteroidia bacterium]|nr:hypothetical protein FACS1894199_05530 [Bacteroidia bacterium]